MSAPAAEAHAGAKKKSKLPLIIVCVLFIGAGAAAPMFIKTPEAEGKEHGHKPKKEEKTAIVPFGELTVNLTDERPRSFLRVKLAVVVEAESEKHLTEELTKFKPALKSKCLAHLAGKSSKDVGGTLGIQRVQRELFDRFGEVLPAEEKHHLRAVLCEEFIIQ